MTAERATGFVLRVHPLTETSLIAHWLTADHGRIATVARGARRPKSPFRGKLDLFYLCDFSFSRSRRSDLHTLREIQLRRAPAALREDLDRLHQAVYAARLIERASEPETPVPGLYALMEELVETLCGPPPRGMTVIAFEVRLLQELGLSPNLASARLSPRARHLLAQFREMGLPQVAALSIAPEQIREMETYLAAFLEEHVGRLPENRGVALSPQPPP